MLKKHIKFGDTDKTIGTIYFALKCVSKQFHKTAKFEEISPKETGESAVKNTIR